MTAPRVLVTGAAVLLILGAAVGAVAALRSRPASEPAPTSITETVNPSPGNTGGYWTEERMRSAEPN